ncbi:MAG TPA: rhodanese-like domain-containing protein [Acidimicrobiales bacterium]|nr:rhodanese-like domain-containing protein [Acidimicrobiales bacterium]
MSVRDVDVAEAFTLVEGDAVLVDVRQPEEFDAGHAPMATLVPLSELPDHLDELPRDALVVCVCRSGARSRRAALFLSEAGFDVANVEGGMLAWAAADLPLESDDGDASIE